VLCVIGDLVEDVVVWLPSALSYGTDTPSKIVRTRGGSAANVAVFAAAVNADNKTKYRSRLIAQIGNDKLGDQLVASLEMSNVEPCVVRGGRTGSIVVIVSPDGERTMLTDRAAATQLTRAPKDWHQNVSILHAPAYSLFSEPLGEATRECISTAKLQNIVVSIDASSASLIKTFGVEKFRQLVTELNPDIFFCNTDEAQVLRLNENPLPLKIVVIKAGSAPTTFITGGTKSTISVLPVEKIVDSTGAGDAFAAGFLTQFAKKGPWAIGDCVLAGHQLAARVLTSPGATMDAQ